MDKTYFFSNKLFYAASTKKRTTLFANIITINDISKWVVYPPAKLFIDLFLACL